MSSNEPLLITLPPQTQGLDLIAPWGSTHGTGPTLQPGSIGYVKGQARSSTLLALLYWTLTEKIDLATVHPILYQSVLEISAHCLNLSSRVQEAMSNMKWSVRGSIRKANNIIQIVLMIQNLGKSGASSDPGLFIRTWNKEVGKLHSITSKKAAAVKLLLECAPEHVLLSILNHVQAKFTCPYMFHPLCLTSPQPPCNST